MPGLDGTALTERVREHSTDGYAYVIVLTGEADEQSAREAMQAGADDLLVKPLDTAALERLRSAVSAMGAPHPAGGWVTISGGIAALIAGESAQRLLVRADRALYEAKLAGRDCIRAAPGELAPA
jgi:PleD family two-component response regulator